MNLIPDRYVPSIFDIPYQRLKKEGIQYLCFDVDNTLGSLDEKRPSLALLQLFATLKKDFTMILISNNTKKRVEPYAMALGVDMVTFACKPSTKGLRKIQKKYHCEKKQMVLIGDQLYTDIYSGKRFSIQTILVDPLKKKDLPLTKITRYLEKRYLRRNRNKLERGVYDRK